MKLNGRRRRCEQHSNNPTAKSKFYAPRQIEYTLFQIVLVPECSDGPPPTRPSEPSDQLLYYEVSSMDVIERIKKQVEENSIVLYMKGTPQFPQCGFSSRTSQALKDCDVEFAWVNVLSDPEIRATLPKFSDWPTFPQLFVNGELVGGADITMEMYQNGELRTLVRETAKPKQALQS